MGSSIYDNGRCKRCFRRLPVMYMKGGLCCGCREEVGLPVEKIHIPLLEDTMSKVIMVEIVKIDEETGKSYSYRVPVPRNMTLTYEKLSQKHGFKPASMDASCNVGDFIIVEDKVYRRIRGGMRPATDDDIAELLAAKLGEALEE